MMGHYQICEMAKARWHYGKRRRYVVENGVKLIRFPKANRGYWYVDGAKRTRKDIGI